MQQRTVLSRLIAAISLLSAAAFLAAGIPAWADRPPPPAAGRYAALRLDLSRFIESEMARAGVVGLSIAVVDDQQTIWSQGFGYADRASGRKATGDTVYRAGSISKLFTATAVMQLAERGRLDIDQPLERYLPEFSIRSRFAGAPPITLRSLLTHHSGLPGNLLKGEMIGAPPPPDYPDRFLSLPASLADTWLSQPPGKVWAYSNLGYALLGCVVARVSGERFVPYIDRHILAPLGMRRSSFLEREELRPWLAKGYVRGKEAEPYYVRDIPAGALLTSANDLARFMKMIFAGGAGPEGASGSAGPAGRLLQPQTLRRMLTPQNAGVALDVDFRIGLGYWLINPLHLPGVRLASHGGDIPPFHSLLVTLPDQKLGVALLTNSEEGAACLFRIATEAVLRGLEAKAGLRPARDDNPVVRAESRALRAHTGLYASPMGLIEIAQRGRHLAAAVFDRTFLLDPRRDGSFSLRGFAARGDSEPGSPARGDSDRRSPVRRRLLALQARLFGHMLLRIQQLEATSITSHEIGGRRYVVLRPGGVFLGIATRIEPAPIPRQWRERAGRYEILNPDPHSIIGDLRLDYDRRREILLLEMQVFDQRIGFPLQPLSEREAVIAGEGRNLGDTVAIVVRPGPGGRGVEERLVYSGYEARRVR